MGGVSLSEMVRVEEAGEGEGLGGLGKKGPAMVFKGNVSTDNRGGFASVRCRNFEGGLDLSRSQGIELRLKVRRRAILTSPSIEC